MKDKSDTLPRVETFPSSAAVPCIASCSSFPSLQSDAGLPACPKCKERWMGKLIDKPSAAESAASAAAVTFTGLKLNTNLAVLVRCAVTLSRTMKHVRVAAFSLTLIFTVALAVAAASPATAATAHGPPIAVAKARTPVWVCPQDMVNYLGRTRYIVSSSRIFADHPDFHIRQYCCPTENGFITREGQCSQLICAKGYNSFTECTQPVPDEFKEFAVMPESSWRNSQPRGTQYYSGGEWEFYTGLRFCCPSNSVCMRVDGVARTPDRSLNRVLLHSMFMCAPAERPKNVIHYFFAGSEEVETTTSASQLLAQRPQEISFVATPVPAIDISSHCDNHRCRSNEVCHPTIDSYQCHCPAGSFRPKQAPTVCEPCIMSGSYCGPGSTKEEDCPSGFYCRTPSSKVACSNGFDCGPRSVAPTPCPRNMVCLEQSQGVDKVTKELVEKPSVSFMCWHRKFPATCPGNASMPIARREGSCGNCRPGYSCPQLCRKPRVCLPGSYCPDGIHSYPCPRGHECDGAGLVEPTKCLAGTYQPEEGQGVMFSKPLLRSSPTSPGRTMCARTCNENHWNEDGAAECNLFGLFSTLHIVLIIVFLLSFSLGTCWTIIFWRPAYRDLYTAAWQEYTAQWNQRLISTQQEIVQRVLRNVLTPVFTTMSIQHPTAVSKLDPEVIPRVTDGNVLLNLSVLTEYRNYLSTHLVEFLQSPTSPPILWLLCCYPAQLDSQEFQSYLSQELEAEIMKELKPFMNTYMQAQQHMHSASYPVDVFTPLHIDVVNHYTVDIRANLKAEMTRVVDQWIRSKGVGEIASSGIRLPSSEERLFPPPLAINSKVKMECALRSFHQSIYCCRKSSHDTKLSFAQSESLNNHELLPRGFASAMSRLD